MPGDQGIYTMLSVGGKAVAALYEQPAQQQEAGVPPAWYTYFTVEDADAAAGKVKELGGNVHMDPFDVGEAGRMTYVQDPQGAFFSVWQPRETIGASLVNAHGAITLTQLNTKDPEAAGKFYTDLFGWSVERQGEDGDQPYWGLFNDGAINGGMMNLPEESPAPPHWLVYFGFDDLGKAERKIGELGGHVLVAPMEIPSGRIAVAQDPQGAFFALFEGDMDP